ncbi:MAG TPA: hypothetical protein VMU16_06600 [Candidatus Binataceae bacterium]|nr:hypothetical protein [Candidatus Binataceae bacterium]
MLFIASALIIAGVALFVAAPLGGGLLAARRKSDSELEVARLERERGMAVQGLRELDFDREMGKVGDADFNSMHAALEARALNAMTEIEKLRTQPKRPQIVLLTAVAPPPRVESPSPQPVAARPEQPRPAAARRVRFCPRCGERAKAGANFCAECGGSLKLTPVASAGKD